jgi:hypothetical protein
LEDVLIHVHDLPDHNLVKILQFIVSQADPVELTHYVREKEKREHTRYLLQDQSGQDHFLDLILSSPRNHVFLTRDLKVLSSSEIAFLMKYLNSWLVRLKERSEESLKRKAKSRLPKMAQILDWIAMMIDAHFTQLVVANHHHHVLIDIYEQVQEQLQRCDEVEELKGFLSLFERHNTTLPAKNISNYSIEVLQL